MSGEGRGIKSFAKAFYLPLGGIIKHIIKLPIPADAGIGCFGFLIGCGEGWQALWGVVIKQVFERNKVGQSLVGIFVVIDRDITDIHFGKNEFEIVVHHDVFTPEAT